MKRFNNILCKVNCIFLLGVFLFANTPKKFLHDAITNHKHTTYKEKSCSHKHIEVTATGYHCDTDNLVTDGVYILVFEPTFLFTEPAFAAILTETTYSAETFNQHCIQLRGPPVC